MVMHWGIRDMVEHMGVAKAKWLTQAKRHSYLVFDVGLTHM